MRKEMRRMSHPSSVASDRSAAVGTLSTGGEPYATRGSFYWRRRGGELEGPPTATPQAEYIRKGEFAGEPLLLRGVGHRHRRGGFFS